MKTTFNSHVNKTHFHNKGFALSLVLIMRVFETCKGAIFRCAHFNRLILIATERAEIKQLA